MMCLVGYMGAPPTIGSPAASPSCGSVMAAAPIRAAARVLTNTVRLMVTSFGCIDPARGDRRDYGGERRRVLVERSQSLERENVIAATNVEIERRHASSAMPPATDLEPARQSLSQSVRSSTASWPGR